MYSLLGLVLLVLLALVGTSHTTTPRERERALATRVATRVATILPAEVLLLCVLQ